MLLAGCGPGAVVENREALATCAQQEAQLRGLGVDLSRIATWYPPERGLCRGRAARRAGSGTSPCSGEEVCPRAACARRAARNVWSPAHQRGAHIAQLASTDTGRRHRYEWSDTQCLSTSTPSFFARSTGGEFSADALTRRFGGSKRDNVELAAQAKVAIAGEAMGERLAALEAAGVPADIVNVFRGLAEAFGEATLRLEDALRRRREQDALALANALAAGEARVNEAVARERAAHVADQAEKQTALDAAQRRIAELEGELAAAQVECGAALEARGEAAALLSAAREREAAAAREVERLREAQAKAEERVQQLKGSEEHLRGQLAARSDAEWATEKHLKELYRALTALGQAVAEAKPRDSVPERGDQPRHGAPMVSPGTPAAQVRRRSTATSDGTPSAPNPQPRQVV